MRVIQTLFLSFLLSLSSIGVWANTDSEKNLQTINLQLNWHHQFEFAGYYAALNKGFYQQAGLNVKLLPWKSDVDVTESVLSGKADIGIGYSSVVIDFAKGKPLQLLFPAYQVSPVVFLSHIPIDRLEDLNNLLAGHSGGMYQLELLKQRALLEANAQVHFDEDAVQLQSFIDKEVDLYAAYATNEPFELKQKQIPFSVVDPKSFGIQSYGDYLFTSRKFAMSHTQSLQAFKEATIKGWNYALDHPQEIVEIILENYPIQKSADALKAEAKETERYVRPAGVKVGDLDKTKLYNFLKDAKNLGYITPQELQNVNLDKFIFNPEQQVFSLEEQAYIANLNDLSIDIFDQVSPYTFVDPQNGWQGLCNDYWRYLSDYLGIKLQPTVKKWSQIQDSIRAKKQQNVVACTIADRTLNQQMLFTDQIMNMPLVLASNQNVGLIKDFKSLMGLKLAVIDNLGLYSYLKHYYPKLDLYAYDSMQEAFNAVQKRHVNGVVGGFATLNNAIQAQGIGGIRIVSDLGASLPLSIAVPRSNPLLYSVLQKSLLSMSVEDENTILNQWLKVNVVNQIDDQRLWQILTPALVLIALLLVILAVILLQRFIQKRYLSRIYELSNAAYLDVQSQKIIWGASSFWTLIGQKPEQVVGKQPYTEYFELVKNSEAESGSLTEKVEACQPWHGEVIIKNAHAPTIWLQVQLSPKLNWLGGCRRVLMTSTNISDRKRIEDLLIRDELTGLYNRRFYNEVIESRMGQAARSGKNIGFVLMDIDYFKKVNDDYGHLYGDQALTQIGDVLKQQFNRAEDLVFRMGGEEFLALISCECEENLFQYLEAVRIAVEDLAIENTKGVNGVVTLSFGAYCVKSAELYRLDEDSIFRQVDELLYLAKNSGRNRVKMKQRGLQAVAADSF